MFACIFRLIPPPTCSPTGYCCLRLDGKDDRTTSNSVYGKKKTIKLTTIVDFGGGAGHLGMPLALLLPNCKIVVVDLNRRSIDLLIDQERRKLYAGFITSSSFGNDHYNDKPSFLCCDVEELVVIVMVMVTVMGGENKKFLAISSHFMEPFKTLLIYSIRRLHYMFVGRLQTYVFGRLVAPCCVGKLSAKAFNPDVFHAAGQNNATITYPQSDVFCKLTS